MIDSAVRGFTESARRVKMISPTAEGHWGWKTVNSSTNDEGQLSGWDMILDHTHVRQT